VIRTDETWHRLREWTYGQAPSERLAAQVLLDDGFTGVDPSHPLGGRDGGKDAVALRDGDAWLVAVYFPRGQQTFGRIKAKLLSDCARVADSDVVGVVFVTNQELSLGERRRLREAAGAPLELMHLERITAVLDQPRMYGVRAQFLKIAVPGATGADGSSPTVEPREVEQLEIEFRGALEGEFGFLSTRGLPRDLRRGEPRLPMAQVFVPLRVAPPVDMRIVRGRSSSSPTGNGAYSSSGSG
jgi:hypothetical protein